MQSWLHVIDWRATADPELVALVDDRESLTYRQLRERIESRAGGWHHLGLRSGDVVAVAAHNSCELLVTSLAVQRVGAIPLLLNWRMPGPEISEILKRTEPTALYVDESCLPLVVDVADQVRMRVLDSVHARAEWADAAQLVGEVPQLPADRLDSRAISVLMHTSGTTGLPKVIPLDHGSLVRSLAGFAIDIGDQVRGSRHLVMMPLFHLAGYAQAMQVLLTGGTAIIHDGFDVDRVITTIASERIEFFTAAPTIIDMLTGALEGTHRDCDVSSLREVQYGASPIDPLLLERAVRVVCSRFRQIYGSTELQGFLSVLRPPDHSGGSPRLASAGQIALGWQARVVDAEERPLISGEPGELQVRGEGLISGYWNDPAATAAAWTDDGWYRTGDLAVLDADRYLTIVGRTKDMIISGGENIYPAQIERVLQQHPDVAEAAVVAQPHPRWGETPVAYVIAAPGRTPQLDQLMAYCGEHLAKFKCPTRIEVLAELPRNALGKVQKVTLREMAAKSA